MGYGISLNSGDQMKILDQRFLY